MAQREYGVESVTVDGEPVRTGRWSSVTLPEPAATGAVIAPHGVVNNPRFRILAVDGDEWETEDTGLRTMEWGDEAEQAVTDLTVRCLAGRLLVRRDSERVVITRGEQRLVLGPVAARVEIL